jgi:hypothetical protein
MADATDPGGYEHRAERQLERVHRQVGDANRSEILHTVRKGKRGTIPSPNPNQMHKTAWEPGTVRNNARNLRHLAGEMEGLDAAEHEGLEWDGTDGRSGYPDRILDLDADGLNDLIKAVAAERGWSDGTERDYCMSVRNHLLA